MIPKVFWRVALTTVVVGLIGCGVEQGLRSGNDSQDFQPGNISGADLPDRTLSLTFDDGPTAATLPIARFLETRGIAATFYVLGNVAASQTTTLQKLQKMGHLVANHTWTHVGLDTPGNLSPYEEVARSDRLISPYVPGANFLFRAPYGAFPAHLADHFNRSGLSKYVGPIHWNIGGSMENGFAADWACWQSYGLSIDECARRYLAEVRYRRRGIVLMHDNHAETEHLTKRLIPWLIAEGYRFVRNDQVPGIAAKLRAGGASPGAGVRPPFNPVQFGCPAGSTGGVSRANGHYLCKSGDNAVGPFSPAMRTACVNRGGGNVTCDTDRWGWDFALKIFNDVH